MSSRGALATWRSRVFVVSLLAMTLVSLQVHAKNLIPALEKTPVAAAHPPKVPVTQLPSQLKIYTYENHELPLFEARVYVPVGSAYENSKKAGVSELTAEMLASGGTTEHAPEELDVLLDEKSIHLEADAGRELTWVTVRSLKENWKEALALLWQVVQSPRFDPKRFQNTQNRWLDSLKRQEDLPASVAAREIVWALYGHDSPWSNIATLKTAKKLRREDVIAWHEKYFQIQRMTLVAAGDFSTQALKQITQKWTHDRQPKEVIQPVWSTIPFDQKAKTIKIKRPINQSVIQAGQMAIARNDPDRFVYELLQHIVGGTVFLSRLGVDVRVQRGLAYGIGSSWEENPVRGTMRIYAQTKKEQTDLVIERIRTILSNLATHPDITAKELDEAKKSFVYQYVFWFESPFEIPFQKAKLDLLGYPKNYLDTFVAKIKSVTLAQVNAAAQKYLKPDQLKFVIVGP